LPEIIGAAYSSSGKAPSAAAVAKKTFIVIAQIHASFWKKKSLLETSNNWLRGQEWLQGKGKNSWEASQQLINGMWTQYTAETKNVSIKWNPVVRAAVDKAVTGILPA
jgi:hypothetical protein